MDDSRRDDVLHAGGGNWQRLLRIGSSRRTAFKAAAAGALAATGGGTAAAAGGRWQANKHPAAKIHKRVDLAGSGGEREDHPRQRRAHCAGERAVAVWPRSLAQAAAQALPLG